MPSAFSHAFAAISMGSVFNRKQLFKMLTIGSVCAAFPDIDAIGFHAGIPYNSLWGHRGITHSLFFAALLSLIVLKIFYSDEITNGKNRTMLFVYFFLSTASHPLLDMLTDGGLGVALFSPFDTTRYFFPFRPVHVAPISISGFFTGRGLEVFKSEFVWIWIPGIVWMILVQIFKKGKRVKD